MADEKRAVCLDAAQRVKYDSCWFSENCQRHWDEIDTTLVNRKTKTKLWTPANLTGGVGGVLYLDDVAVFDHFAQQLLVFRLVLFLLQFCCMLWETGVCYSFCWTLLLQELQREAALPVTS